MPPALASPGMSQFPSATDHTMVIVSARGAAAVEYGVALAKLGYRPVPLFNACPMPPIMGPEIVRSAIDARAIVDALIVGADLLTQTTLPPDAPPAFLVDALRLTPAAPIDENTFDNRSVLFASDFPSVKFLRTHGITRALLVHDNTLPIGDDLLHALAPWKAGGLPVAVIDPEGATLDASWPHHGIWGEIATRALAFFRLRRNSRGGFGAFVPEASGG